MSPNTSHKINRQNFKTVEERIADFEIRLNSARHRRHFGNIIYALIILLLAAAQAIAIVVIAFGFIATAVCVLVGRYSSLFHCP